MSGTIVEAADLATLDAVLQSAGLPTHPAGGDRRLVEAEPEVVARLAMANDVVLYRLEPTDHSTAASAWILVVSNTGVDAS
jgi:hypothetical protein